MAEQRLIDANALIDWLTRATGFRTNCDDCTDIDCLDCIIEEAIKNAPTVEAKPVVHAHWQKYDDSEFCYCSYCGKPSAEDDNVSWHGYCPICGATMDEELERLNCGAQMDEKENDNGI